MTRLSVVMLACSVAAGCATVGLGKSQYVPPPARVVQITAPFDGEAARLALQAGTNTIQGNAFLSQRSGRLVTCAGREVRLIPATAYAKEKMAVLFGPFERGFARDMPTAFNPDPFDYAVHQRSVPCDSQGNFTFDRVADGDYFAVVKITWMAGYSEDGGILMHRYQVSGGASVSRVLSI